MGQGRWRKPRRQTGEGTFHNQNFCGESRNFWPVMLFKCLKLAYKEAHVSIWFHIYVLMETGFLL